MLFVFDFFRGQVYTFHKKCTVEWGAEQKLNWPQIRHFRVGLKLPGRTRPTVCYCLTIPENMPLNKALEVRF